MIALVHALGIIPTEATGRFDNLGPGAATAAAINLPVSDIAKVLIENKTDLDVVIQYWSPSQTMTMHNMAASQNLTSRDMYKSSRTDQAKSSEMDASKSSEMDSSKSATIDKTHSAVSTSAGVTTPWGGGNASFSNESGSEKHQSNEAEKQRSNEAEKQRSNEVGAQRSKEADSQRGNEQRQDFGLVLDVERREMELNHTETIYAGQAFPAHMPKTEHDKNWFFIVRYAERANVGPVTQPIGYSTKYIEIAEPPAGRRLPRDILDTKPALKPIVTAYDEVPSHLVVAPRPPPCERCLPIEDKSERAMEALRNTQFRIDGRTYIVQRLTPNDDDIVWKPEDGSESLLVARKSLIGKKNPFFLFHKQSAYDWLINHPINHPKDCTEVSTIAESGWNYTSHREGGSRPFDTCFHGFSQTMQKCLRKAYDTTKGGKSLIYTLTENGKAIDHTVAN